MDFSSSAGWAGARGAEPLSPREQARVDALKIRYESAEGARTDKEGVLTTTVAGLRAMVASGQLSPGAAVWHGAVGWGESMAGWGPASEVVFEDREVLEGVKAPRGRAASAATLHTPELVRRPQPSPAATAGRAGRGGGGGGGAR
jgi:hypothetical protein